MVFVTMRGILSTGSFTPKNGKRPLSSTLQGETAANHKYLSIWICFLSSAIVTKFALQKLTVGVENE
jgi:hypothetical protein